MILLGMGAGFGQQVDSQPPMDHPTRPAVLIPAGQGHWVRIDEEIDVETIAQQRVVLAYGPPLAAGGARGEVPGAPAAEGQGGDLIAYRVAAIAHPLEGDERCQMAVIGLVLVHRNGSTEELPAHGYVLDNSDGRRGFRLETSPTDHRRLVIPAHATATVVFSTDVLRAAAAPGR